MKPTFDADAEWANNTFASLDPSPYVSPPKPQPNTPSPAPYMQSVRAQRRLVELKSGPGKIFETKTSLTQNHVPSLPPYPYMGTADSQTKRLVSIPTKSEAHSSLGPSRRERKIPLPTIEEKYLQLQTIPAKHEAHYSLPEGPIIPYKFTPYRPSKPHDQEFPLEPHYPYGQKPNRPDKINHDPEVYPLHLFHLESSQEKELPIFKRSMETKDQSSATSSLNAGRQTYVYSRALKALDLNTGSFRTTPIEEEQLNLSRLQSTLFPISPRNISRQDTNLKSSSHHTRDYSRTFLATSKIEEPSQRKIVTTTPESFRATLAPAPEPLRATLTPAQESFRAILAPTPKSFKISLNNQIIEQSEEERSLAELAQRMNTREESGERSQLTKSNTIIVQSLEQLVQDNKKLLQQPFRPALNPNPNATDSSTLPPPPPPPLTKQPSENHFARDVIEAYLDAKQKNNNSPLTLVGLDRYPNLKEIKDRNPDLYARLTAKNFEWRKSDNEALRAISEQLTSNHLGSALASVEQSLQESILKPHPEPQRETTTANKNSVSIKAPNSTSAGVSLTLPSLGATPTVEIAKLNIQPSENPRKTPQASNARAPEQSTSAHEVAPIHSSNALTSVVPSSQEMPPLLWDLKSSTNASKDESQSSSSETLKATDVKISAQQESPPLLTLPHSLTPSALQSQMATARAFTNHGTDEGARAPGSLELASISTRQEQSLPGDAVISSGSIVPSVPSLAYDKTAQLKDKQSVTSNTNPRNISGSAESPQQNSVKEDFALFDTTELSASLSARKESISRHSNSGTPSAVNAQQVSFSANKDSQNSAIPNAVVSSVDKTDSIKNENASPLKLGLKASLPNPASIMESSSKEIPSVNDNSASNGAKPENPSIQPNVTTTESPSTHVTTEKEIKPNETSKESNQLNDTAAVLETNPIKTPSKTRQPLRFLSSLLTSILTSLISFISSKIYNVASRNLEQDKQPQGSIILQNEDLKTIENGKQDKDLKTERDPDQKTTEVTEQGKDSESVISTKSPNTVITLRGNESVTKLKKEEKISRTPS